MVCGWEGGGGGWGRVPPHPTFFVGYSLPEWTERISDSKWLAIPRSHPPAASATAAVSRQPSAASRQPEHRQYTWASSGGEAAGKPPSRIAGFLRRIANIMSWRPRGPGPPSSTPRVSTTETYPWQQTPFRMETLMARKDQLRVRVLPSPQHLLPRTRIQHILRCPHGHTCILLWAGLWAR